MDLFKVTGDRFTLGIPLAKYDERTGEFEGLLAVEELDKANEIIDLDKSFPHFEAWQSGFAKATDGQSFGNVREQHDAKKAAGKLTAPLEKTTTTDGKPAWKVRGLAVDPVTKQKLADRVLVALSIGGEYTEKSEAEEIGKGVIRYVAKPSEVSLVDNPCMPSAMITVIKVDGQETTAKAVGFQPEQGWKCRAGWEHGHSRKEEAKACDGSTPVKKSVEETSKDELKKSLYTVAQLTSIIQTMRSMSDDLDAESQAEGDPDDAALSDRVDTLCAALFDLAGDVLAEEKADDQPDDSSAPPTSAMQMAALAESLKKSPAKLQSVLKSLYVPSGNGSRSNKPNPIKEATPMEAKKEEKKVETESVAKTDEGALAKIVESTITKGFAGLKDELTKTFNAQFASSTERADKIEKSVADARDEFSKDVNALQGVIAKAMAFITNVTVDDESDLDQVLKAIAGKPAAPKANLRAISKSEDSKSEAVEPARKLAPRTPERILMDDAILVAQV